MHLDVDPIELVEARPGAARSQPLEKLSHGDVVEAVRAIEYDTLHRQRLGQVFGRFCLAGSSGTFETRCKAKMHERVEHEENVAIVVFAVVVVVVVAAAAVVAVDVVVAAVAALHF